MQKAAIVAACGRPRLAVTVGAVHIAALMCLVYLGLHYPAAPLLTWSALFWLGLSLTAHYSVIPIFSSGSPNTISPGFIVSAAILALFNPLVGAVLLSMGGLGERDFKLRRPMYQILYSRSMYVVCATISAEAFRRAPGGIAMNASPKDLVMRMAPMVLIYFIVNTCLVRARVAAEDDEAFFDRYPFSGDLLVSYLFMGLLAMVVVLLARVHLVLAISVVGPIWGWRFCLDRVVALREANEQLVQSFADALDLRDHDTAGHTRRVAALGRMIGHQLHLSRRELNAIYAAGSLHDLGKIGIPDEILLKPGRLAREEFERMKMHPVMGATLLQPYRHLHEVTKIMRHHHEKFDGSGYPDQLSAEDIPIGARIIAVADTFMVIADGRPYRPARPVCEAVKEIERCSGTQFDPRVVKAFLTLDASMVLEPLTKPDARQWPILRSGPSAPVWSRLLGAKLG